MFGWTNPLMQFYIATFSNFYCNAPKKILIFTHILKNIYVFEKLMTVLNLNMKLVRYSWPERVSFLPELSWCAGTWYTRLENICRRPATPAQQSPWEPQTQQNMKNNNTSQCTEELTVLFISSSAQILLLMTPTSVYSH